MTNKIQNQFDEIQKQFASMNMDSWYRFGIDSENSKTNAEVFESAVESIEYLDNKIEQTKQANTNLFKVVLLVTALVQIEIVAIAWMLAR
tara:strand:+ start:258 stop:527 length:270 start_codon:yes stop_codon:yes gene_type:complete